MMDETKITEVDPLIERLNKACQLTKELNQVIDELFNDHNIITEIKIEETPYRGLTVMARDKKNIKLESFTKIISVTGEGLF